MGCGCKKKKVEGEVVKVETGAPSTSEEVKIEETKSEENKEN